MATQQETATATLTEAESPIEGEFSSYRAISSAAVFSMILGLLSTLSFAHWFFAVLGGLAVVVGAIAKRNIRIYSDILTGGGFATFGIALALISVLSSSTIGVVQDQIRIREASKFAEQYAQVLKSGNENEALYLQLDPEGRRGKTPDQVVKEMVGGSPNPQMFELQAKPIRDIKARLLGAPGEEIHFERIEAIAPDGLRIAANALFDLHGPGSRDYPEKQQFLLARLKGGVTDGKYEWMVEEVIFPYKLASYVEKPKPVDDGHGHAH